MEHYGNGIKEGPFEGWEIGVGGGGDGVVEEGEVLGDVGGGPGGVEGVEEPLVAAVEGAVGGGELLEAGEGLQARPVHEHAGVEAVRPARVCK